MGRSVELRAVQTTPPTFTAPWAAMLSTASVTTATLPMTLSALVAVIRGVTYRRTKGLRQAKKQGRHHQEHTNLHRQACTTQSGNQGGQGASHKPQGDQRHRGSFQDAKEDQKSQPNCNFHVHIFLSSYLMNSIAGLQ